MEPCGRQHTSGIVSMTPLPQHSRHPVYTAYSEWAGCFLQHKLCVLSSVMLVYTHHMYRAHSICLILVTHTHSVTPILVHHSFLPCRSPALIHVLLWHIQHILHLHFFCLRSSLILYTVHIQQDTCQTYTGLTGCIFPLKLFKWMCSQKRFFQLLE